MSAWTFVTCGQLDAYKNHSSPILHVHKQVMVAYFCQHLSMVAYFCHHLSVIYVDLSEIYHHNQ